MSQETLDRRCPAEELLAGHHTDITHLITGLKSLRFGLHGKT